MNAQKNKPPGKKTPGRRPPAGRTTSDLRALAAAVLGCRPEQLLSFYAPPDGGVMAVGPQGQKVYLSAEQLEQIERNRLPGARHV